jgi:hypothetical protein
MPFIDTTTDESAIVFYNVVHAVGKNCPNQLNDVKLVQMLLQLFYSRSGFQPPSGFMTIDGICGPVTKRWITTFQSDIRKQGLSVLVDSRVDRARNHQMTASISSTIYTIAWLNVLVNSYDSEAWASIPGFVPMQDAASVPAPSNDYVSDLPAVQSTSPGGFGRTPTSPAVQSTSPR